MRRAILILICFGIPAAHAAGVNDRMPNGQQGYQPYAQAPPFNVTPPTPNWSGQYYRWRMYHQARHPPAVRGSIYYRNYRYRHY